MPHSLAALHCVTLGRQNRIKRVDIKSLDDVRALAAWCSMPMTHAGTRRALLDAVVAWMDAREVDLARREREQADRERGCVALLLDAAQRVGEAATRPPEK